MQKNKVVVISDLHISAPPLDDFDAELETCLCDFLAALATDDAAIDLVVNGDLLDFVQAPPWEGTDLEASSEKGIPLCFTQKQSVTKLKAILSQHQKAFRAIRKFLIAKSDSRLTILPGNHDVDFFWEDVREEFKESVSHGYASVRDRITFHLERVYHPESCPWAWIEHGHQYDPVNWFRMGKTELWSERKPPMLRGSDGEERLFECTGTRFLIKLINRLDSDYHFVDNIKPFSRFLRLLRLSCSDSDYGPLKARIAYLAMLDYLRIVWKDHPADILAARMSPGVEIAKSLAKLVERLSDREKRQFIGEIEKAGFPLSRPLLMFLGDEKRALRLLRFLAEHISVLDSMRGQPRAVLGFYGDSRSLKLLSHQIRDETQVLMGAAKKALANENVRAVIMGHTHEHVDFCSELPYANTGCWIRYASLDGVHPSHVWEVLRSPPCDLPYQLYYAELDNLRRPVHRLRMFRSGGHAQRSKDNKGRRRPIPGRHTSH